jgi:hypothetical protein
MEKEVLYKEILRDNLFRDIECMLNEAYSITKNDLLTSMNYAIPVFCALRLEAFANIAGTELYEEWDEIERKLSFKAKMNFLAKIINQKINWSIEPEQTSIRIFKIRNEIAHPKSHKKVFSDVIPLKEAEDRMYNQNPLEGTSKIRQTIRDIDHDILISNTNSFIEKWSKLLLGETAFEVLNAVGEGSMEIIKSKPS